MHGLAERLLIFAAALMLATYAVRQAFEFVRPVLPLLAFGAVVYGFLRWQRR